MGLSEGRANKEAQLLYGDSDKYGIYQLKDIPEMRQFRFAGTESLKRMGIIKDKLDQYGMDAEIVDVAVVGSRCRGLERESSDLDVASGKTLKSIAELRNASYWQLH